MFTKMKKTVVSATEALCAMIYLAITSLVAKKSEAINQVVVIAILLVVAIAGVLVYWGFAEGLIQDVFARVQQAINDLFA